jgi:hypothetical protein
MLEQAFQKWFLQGRQPEVPCGFKRERLALVSNPNHKHSFAAVVYILCFWKSLGSSKSILIFKMHIFSFFPIVFS